MVICVVWNLVDGRITRGYNTQVITEICDSIIMESARIGKNANMRKAIIDKSVDIPGGTSIGYNHEENSKHFTMTEKGVVVVRKEMYLE